MRGSEALCGSSERGKWCAKVKCSEPFAAPIDRQQELKGEQILILGAGWISTFLIPLLEAEQISFAATTTTGRDNTIKFRFDPDSDNPYDYDALPDARTILITFPLKGKGQSKHLLDMYSKSHPHAHSPNYMQLGSTGIFSIPEQTQWVTRHSTYDVSNDRAIAEDELLSLNGCVLNLSGLWGGSRQPRDFVSRVVTSKEQLKGKGSLHMIHGQDVARAILGMHRNYTPGERWVRMAFQKHHCFLFCLDNLDKLTLTDAD